MDSVLRPFIDRVRAAAAAAVPLAIRGGGTKGFLFDAPPAGEPLDTAPLAGVLGYEPSELVATVRAGTPLAEVEALLAEAGQCLPFEPPHFGPGATVGGMVAAGLAGPARASAGGVRDFVLGLGLVNGRGEHLLFGGEVMKNVAGYDVSRLMAGAFGTLGLITQVSLKVLPQAPAEATLRFACCGQDEALRLLAGWGARPLPLSASRWEEEEAGGGRGVLRLRLRGAVAAVGAATHALCAAHGGTVEAPQEAAQGWHAVREQTLPWFARRADAAIWRLSVPQTAAALAVPAAAGAPLVEWHGGQRWYAVAGGDPDAGRALRAAAARTGGHATLWRVAPGGARGVARRDAVAAPLGRIQEALRREFDPHGVFNPGLAI
ncbi:glycolate oxidase subunit GlcE [Xylophilus sp.]|uniref:glycolate oxidase subunit GlcE n=1 Tax=Xylophilus sp. TaxID=2653893 RepID=UPI0013BDFEB5|nr:glycolate oxidase subunit GlcE [Xylophilus sp.]KAF1050292.1 MAG: putative FAD-linked oxidoreductase [Xylophilus sp.]